MRISGRVVSSTLVLLLIASTSLAADPGFRVHEIDLEAVYSAASAIDVNHDGKLDIVTGGEWYEAPDWKRHKVREVEFIRGRYDDYTNLPLDVNGDGWTDFVIANYRSEKVGWVEHPGKSLGLWTEHVVEKPGHAETGRLYDIDGDGQLDLLPNGRDYLAWWEVIKDKSADGRITPRWVRHDLPQEAMTHGVGFGDINGDGRGDVIGADGWLEAPEDRRTGRWRFHDEFSLDKSASAPIAVVDIDGDGDNDLAWGRGHTTGLWWSEQIRGSELKDGDGKRTWRHHTIDTSWSQPHTVEVADMDNDGKLDIVTGKRYLGHDGNDPGEWNPLCLYWYKWLPESRTFQRFTISEGGHASFDVDPKIIDLDGDGDLDIVAPGRSGLCWCENLLVHSGDAQPSPLPKTPSYSDHAKLLVVRDEKGAERPVTTPADWGLRRSHILAQMQEVMGPLPDPSARVPLDVKWGEESDQGSYIRRKLTYAAEPGDRVAAWLLVPKKIKDKAPAMLCLHSTADPGKDLPVGIRGPRYEYYAAELAERGYVCLVPDYPSFGESHYDLESHKSAAKSGTMKAIWDNMRAIDLLETLPEVDGTKIGAIGHSLGGHNALFTAALDLRIRAVVSSCGFTSFAKYCGGNLEAWSKDRYMPRVATAYHNNPSEMPFDFSEVIAALAPRPFFASAPTGDTNFDNSGVHDCIVSAAEVYELLGARDQLVAEYPDAGHDFPEAAREAAYKFLDRTVKSRKGK